MAEYFGENLEFGRYTGLARSDEMSDSQLRISKWKYAAWRSIISVVL
jgi:hypothetical protein